MKDFSRRITFLMVLLMFLTLMTNACKSGSKRDNSALNKQDIILKITSPAENSPKRILKVETFNTASCFYDRNLTTDHPEYLGILLYMESLDNREINESRILIANKTITIKASLSKVFDAGKSDICYFQPVSFTPKASKSYELYLSSFCEMMIYETDPLNRDPSSDIRLIDIYTENQDC